MTDYSKMTDEQVNEAIAVKRGWVLHSCVGCNHDWWMTPDGGVDYNQTDPPNYTHDWRLCGELLKEMSDSANVVVMLTNGKDWEDGDRWACDLFIDGITNLNPYLYTTPLRAICVGFLVWGE